MLALLLMAVALAVSVSILVHLKKRVKVLQRVIEMDSAQKMERILKWESYLRLERKKTQDLEQELKWKTARVLALESDLERVQSKLMWKDSQ
jgi:predicted Holliday junction resolvase-like endonuclease